MNTQGSLLKPDEYGLLPSSYASDSAYQMARRLARAESQTYADMAQEIGFKLHFNINPGNHDPAKINGVLGCIAAGKEFILYCDKKNYTIFIPRSMAAICYMNGKEYTRDVSGSQDDWADRVKMGIIGYDYFFELPNQIDGQTTEVLQLQ